MKPIVALVAVLIVSVPALAQESGWIGVSIAERPDRGVLVRSVEANSPAERAGLKANDVILQFNNQSVLGVQQLTRLVTETPVGRTVDVVILRDNREQTLKITSEKGPFNIGQMHIQVPEVSVFRDRIQKSIQPLEVKTSVSMSQAGIRADSLTPQLRDFFGVKGGEGVLISSVDSNSAAAKSGLLAGDVVTAVDGQSVLSPQDFTRELRSKTGAFTLKVVRNKQEREIRIEQ